MNEFKYPDMIITVRGKIESEDKIYRARPSKICTASAAAKVLFGVNVKNWLQGSVWTTKFKHEGQWVWIDVVPEDIALDSAQMISPEYAKKKEERLKNAIEI